MIKRISVTIPLLFGIILLSIADVSAQSLGTAISKSRSGATGSDRILENYLDVNSASRERRPEIFSAFSPEAKAGVFRFHLAFQLVKRPDLTGEQKEFILKTLSGIQPDAYDQSKADAVAKARQEAKLTEQGAMHLFSKKRFLKYSRVLQPRGQKRILSGNI
jgi:hypothetical protein